MFKAKTPEGAFVYELIGLLAPLMGQLGNKLGMKDNLIFMATLSQKENIASSLENIGTARAVLREIIDLAGRYDRQIKALELPSPDNAHEAQG